ncbi:MAG TPA: sigma-70 family RNA polymerase sigma factor [Streptosporangiaceae bacterium]|jgi:RNA polymerase sigma factor (sigma-70 family)|nr:sigma-70 family RNA polymerase sigma factor [Streptosporangiaceae bacterium]
MKQSKAARAGGGPTVEESDVGQLVRASVDGSEAAWNELVRRYSPVVASVTRRYRLAAEDAQDVCQTVWLRLVEHLTDLLEPEALPGWLAVTARRECGRQARQRRRDLRTDPHADPCAVQRLPELENLDDRLLRAELRQAVHDGLVQLPAREQRLLRLWSDDPPATYHEISQHLGVPIGSIGPTLRRSLDKLRRTSAMRSYLAAPAGSKPREFAKAS